MNDKTDERVGVTHRIGHPYEIPCAGRSDTVPSFHPFIFPMPTHLFLALQAIVHPNIKLANSCPSVLYFNYLLALSE